ncbi:MULTISPECIES: efflux RND transporter permease subunit [unclassified Novosphingobium]|uniref:efflux RND transporter permease subunit n=1 Tax=unclassified Novosphingobium TaxID=2644732 RepID=UPI0025F36B15|nr:MULTISPECIES: efflux RND transporter permease subunit [unclassified Novosphingobium]HQV04728.1 efflux RND transporter permease subunit [Novosphingobium sp.]
MTERAIRFVLKQWRFVGLLAALLAVLGTSAFFGLPRTEDPQSDGPMFYITAVMPGASAAELEKLVAEPIEDSIFSLEQVREVRSNSRQGVATVYVEFEWGKDSDRAYDALSRELANRRPTLPAELTRMDIVRGRPTSAAIAEVALVSDTLPPRRMHKLSERLRERLSSVTGVERAQVWGLPASEMRVQLDPGKLQARGKSPTEIAAAIATQGREGPVGTVRSDGRRLNVDYAGAFPDADSVGDVALTVSNGAVLQVRDVAEVAWGTARPSHLIRYNGHQAVVISVNQNINVDLFDVTEKIRQVLDDFEKTLPGGVRLERPYFQTENAENRLNHLYRDFLIAFFVVSISLLPLGRNAALVVMTAIPLSLLCGILTLQLFGLSLNQLSIAGLILALGLLVDDAIVITENIVRWMGLEPDADNAIVQGTSQIALAVIGCTACLLFAFLPLLALPEAGGDFVRSLPVAVVGTIVGSLVVALFVIPLVAKLLLRKSHEVSENQIRERIKAAISKWYAPVLKRCLDRPKTAVVILLGATALSIPLLGVIGSSLFPAAQTRQFLVRVEAPESATLGITDGFTRKVEAALQAEPAVQWVIANVGRGNPALYYNQPQKPEDEAFAELVVGLKDWKAETRSKLIDRLRDKFANDGTARLSTVEFVQGAVIEAPIVIRVSGPDLKILRELAGQVETTMAGTKGLRDIKNPLRASQIDMTLDTNEAAAAAYGIGPAELRDAMRIALSGTAVSQLRDVDGDTYPITLHASEGKDQQPGQFAQIYVMGRGGQAVSLDSLVTKRLISGPKQIDRIDRMRVATLTANVDKDVLISRATTDVVERIREAVKLPAGYTLSLGGEAESQDRNFSGLVPAALIGLFGILAVLTLEFGRLRMVTVVIGIIPFGFFGAIVALWLTGNSLSFTASIGLIALIGIEIKNSLLLVEFAEKLRAQGVGIRQATEEAAELRFLPVLLTTVSAVAGLLPLAFSDSGLYGPLAITIIGGLIASTLLARIATPVMYVLLAPASAKTAGSQA